MKTWHVVASTVLVVGLGCSSTYESAEMKIRYQPPRGVKLVEEQPGPPRVARFTSGIEMRSVEAAPPEIDEDQLDALLSRLGAADGIVQSARVGTLRQHKTVRWAMRKGDKRSIIYFVPAGKRYLLLTLTAPASRFAALETRFERSLASLYLPE